MAEAEQKKVREELFEHLKTDLIGPESSDEILVQDFEARTGDNPLSRYLMGILYPANSLVPPDEDDFANDGGESEDEDSPEPPAIVTGMPKPSSIGMSFALENEPQVELLFRYGLYTPAEVVPVETEKEPAVLGKGRKPRPTIRWSRQQIEIPVSLKADAGQYRQELPGGAEAEWIVRPDGGLNAVTVFLRNSNQVMDGPDRPELCMFQPQIVARPAAGAESIVDRSHRLHPGAAARLFILFTAHIFLPNPGAGS